MRDTSTEAAEAQLVAFRRLSPAERVALALEASDWLMAVARVRASTAPAARAVDPPPAFGTPRTR